MGRRLVLPPSLNLVKLPLEVEELDLIRPRPEVLAGVSSPCFQHGRWSALSPPLYFVELPLELMGRHLILLRPGVLGIVLSGRF